MPIVCLRHNKKQFALYSNSERQNMKNIYTLTMILAAGAVAVAGVMSQNGKAGRTNSPGETTCTGCHNSFALNSGGGSASIACSNMMGWQYVPGQTYHMSVTVARTGSAIFGLGFEALKTTGNASTGTFVVTNSAQTHVVNATVSGSTRPNIVHTNNGGVSSNTHTFNFDWTAPTTNVGNITFYTAGVAGNNDGNETGDYVYTSSQILTPMSTTSVNEISDASKTFHVFPNPVHDRVNLFFTDNSITKCDIRIVDSKGSIIQSNVNNTVSSDHQLTLAIEKNIPSGIYFVDVITGEKSSIKKIIINQNQ
jgi:hypothetical protein